ncbi:hypothetical protein JTE90_026730 [Oedothorax gibbosus]|uniref:Uncharacterized protein n=1 Tax=Oedothorax gibbosus TaxID=931172 RepID=A0AAV6U053_9ARAC|nr:hypothetical protein JTE90_026730 [Oedothorax gibbosus]
MGQVKAFSLSAFRYENFTMSVFPPLLLSLVILHTASAAVTGPLIFLTVSSLPSSDHRLVEINWVPEDEAMRDAIIHLYDADPDHNTSIPLMSVQPGSRGYFRTRYRFPEVVFTEANLTDACLHYWVRLTGYDRKVRATNCLRGRPKWMYESRGALSNLSLTDLMLPGTHNAGSYSADASAGTLMAKYLYTQEEDVWSQLVWGVRHLDLRVAYRRRVRGEEEEEFWITHSTFRTDLPVREVARQVRRFLLATREIVVMDFHRFVSGFRDRRSARQRHRELVTLLEEELGDLMIPAGFTSSAPLRLLWDTGRRLYVGYADEGARTRLSSRLFPAVRHLWADADTVKDLKSFLNRSVCGGARSGRLTSAMAQLTPTTSGVLFNVYGGLRQMADQVNRKIGEWFRDEWNDCANIVATDYFLGNNMVELAVATNAKRAAALKRIEETMR